MRYLLFVVKYHESFLNRRPLSTKPFSRTLNYPRISGSFPNVRTHYQHTVYVNEEEVTFHMEQNPRVSSRWVSTRLYLMQGYGELSRVTCAVSTSGSGGLAPGTTRYSPNAQSLPIA